MVHLKLRYVNLPQIIEHQTSDFFHTFTVNFALAPVDLHPLQYRVGNIDMVCYKYKKDTAGPTRNSEVSLYQGSFPFSLIYLGRRISLVHSEYFVILKFFKSSFHCKYCRQTSVQSWCHESPDNWNEKWFLFDHSGETIFAFTGGLGLGPFYHKT